MIMQLLPMPAVQYIYILRLTGDDSRDRDFHDGDDDDDGDRKTSQRAKSQVMIRDFV